MFIFSKQFRPAVVLLGVCTLVISGCASSRPAAPSYESRDPSSRPPETGSNIPRRIYDDAQARPAEPRRTAKSKPAKSNAKPVKEKAKKPARTEVDEDVVIRGGFR